MASGRAGRGDLAADGDDLPHLLAGGADRRGAGADLRLRPAPTAPRPGAERGDGAADLHPPRRQHLAPAEGRGAADGQEEDRGRVSDKLDEAARRAWLRLARTENVGPVTFDQL